MGREFTVEYRRRNNPQWNSLTWWRPQNFTGMDRNLLRRAGAEETYDLLSHMRQSVDCRFIPTGKFAASFTAYERSVSVAEGNRFQIQLFGDRRGIRYLENPALQADFVERQSRGAELKENVAMTIAGAQASVVMLYVEGEEKFGRKLPGTLEIFVLADTTNQQLASRLKQSLLLETADVVGQPKEAPKVIFFLSEGRQLEVTGAIENPFAQRVAIYQEHDFGARRNPAFLGGRTLPEGEILMEKCDPLTMLHLMEGVPAVNKTLKGLDELLDDLDFTGENPSAIGKVVELLNPEGPAEIYYRAIQETVLGLTRADQAAVRRALAGRLEDQIYTVADNEPAPRIFTRFVNDLLVKHREGPAGTVEEIANLLRTFGPEEEGGFGFFTGFMQG